VKKKRYYFLACILAIFLFVGSACFSNNLPSTGVEQSALDKMENSEDLGAEGDSIIEDNSSGNSSVESSDTSLELDNSTTQDSLENEKEESGDGWVDIEFQRP